MLTPARGLSRLDAAVLGAAGLWCVWVVTATAWAGRPVPDALPYLAPVLVGGLGVAAGRRARSFPASAAAGVLLALGALFILMAALTPEPGKLPTTYPNANAALGTQLLALVGLAALQARGSPRPEPRTAMLLFGAAVAAVGVLAINDSQAGWLVALPVALVVLIAASTRWGPWRWLTALLGVAAMAGAGAALLWLARLPEWPGLATRALHPVRQQLWGEALGLWAQRPLTGGGAGSFAESNPLAVDPDTAPAHSSVLQVGAEFGLIGLGLFALLLLAGLTLALRRDRASGVIAATAWTALFVHSVMDHLYDFGLVCLAAGAVLGWAGSAPHDPHRRYAQS